jgi:hypothetical protein
MTRHPVAGLVGKHEIVAEEPHGKRVLLTKDTRIANGKHKNRRFIDKLRLIVAERQLAWTNGIDGLHGAVSVPPPAAGRLSKRRVGACRTFESTIPQNWVDVSR